MGSPTGPRRKVERERDLRDNPYIEETAPTSDNSAETLYRRFDSASGKDYLYRKTTGYNTRRSKGREIITPYTNYQRLGVAGPRTGSRGTSQQTQRTGGTETLGAGTNPVVKTQRVGQKTILTGGQGVNRGRNSKSRGKSQTLLGV